jgi:hypothetical protein
MVKANGGIERPHRRAMAICARAWRMSARVIALLLLPVVGLADPPVSAVSSYRIAAAVYKYDQTGQVAVALRRKGECAWRDWNMELVAGVIHSPQATRPFLSVGPVWCWPLPDPSLYLEISLSPTVIAGSRIEGRDLGGDFHFTSSVALGSQFGRRKDWSVSLKFQHISNGGLNRPNPGMNLVGLDFSHRHGRR